MRPLLVRSLFAFALLLTQVRFLAAGSQTPAPVTPAAAAFADAVKLHDAGKFAEAIPLFQRAAALGYQPISQARGCPSRRKSGTSPTAQSGSQGCTAKQSPQSAPPASAATRAAARGLRAPEGAGDEERALR